MYSREERRRSLMNVGRKHLNRLFHIEYKCPVCGGIATICYEDNYIVAECHACSTRTVEKEM